MLLVDIILLRRIWPALKIGFLASLFFVFIGTTYAYADSISRSFKSKDYIQPGSVVAITKDDRTSVELAPANLPDRIYGVVISPSDSAVSLQIKNQLILVANGGSYSVLVNTQQGAIVSGNYLSISSTPGVADKAIDSDTYILGRALENFDGTGPEVTKTASGVAQGKIKVQLAPGKNPLINNGGLVPGIIRRIAESIAGRPLSTLKIYLVMSIFLITLTVSFLLIWVGVRSGILSIGRNPLSRHSIMQSLSQVIISSLLVFFGGLVGIYLLLRL